MQPISEFTGLVVPLDRDNVDTDAIIPKQFLKSIRRTGFGPHLFDEWRWLDHGEPGMDLSLRAANTSFVLNQPRYQGASVLLGRRNFGCGSSREHAAWALLQFGIRAVIASDFADIFKNNALKNGLVTIALPGTDIDTLFAEVAAAPGYRLRIDIVTQTVTAPGGKAYCFELDSFRRDCLIRGLDDIGLVLEQSEKIRLYEATARIQRPWLFPSVSTP